MDEIQVEVKPGQEEIADEKKRIVITIPKQEERSLEEVQRLIDFHTTQKEYWEGIKQKITDLPK